SQNLTPCVQLREPSRSFSRFESRPGRQEKRYSHAPRRYPFRSSLRRQVGWSTNLASCDRHESRGDHLSNPMKQESQNPKRLAGETNGLPVRTVDVSLREGVRPEYADKPADEGLHAYWKIIRRHQGT